LSSAAVAERPHEPGRAASAAGLRRAKLLAGAFSLLLIAGTTEIVIDASVGHSALVPKSPSIAKWLGFAGERLGYRVFLIALLVLVGAYAGIVLLAANRRLDAISVRWAIALLAALELIVFAGPILLSTDVFSYIAYARMGVTHGVNPYIHGPHSIFGDPVYRYVGSDWRKVATAYGPIYTLLTYPLAPLGLTGALWAAKTQALLASAGTLALTWRCARLRDLDPKLALLIVGANPLYFIYGLGGAHNDLIMTLLMMAGVALMLTSERRRRHEALAGAWVVVGALVKATAIVPLPFMVLSRRRLAPVLGAAVAALLGALLALAVFGIHGVDVISALNRDAGFVSTDSFPTEIAHLFGKPGIFPVDHALLKAALVAIVLYLMWRTWRGYDWIAASGWTLLAIVVTSTWLLAWYTLWTLPLAAVSRDRRLLVATLAVQALFVIHQISPLLAPVS
jgi:Glycosyltransferase family 87